MLGLRCVSALTLTLAFVSTFPPISVLAQTNGPAARSIRIQGVVLNSVTHEPIGRALVSSQDIRFATMTDDRGRFQFVLTDNASRNGSALAGTQGAPATPDARPNFLIARRPGFLSPRNEQQAQLSGDQTEVTLYLVPEALVIGRINVAESSGVEVELFGRQLRDGVAHWTSAGVVRSRSNGEFRFADLSPGTYKLFTREQLDRDPLTFDPRGQLFGYPPIYFPSANNFAAASTLQLTAGSRQQVTLTPVRRPYYPVEIGVINAPAGGLEVNVFVAGQPGPGYSLGFNPGRESIQGSLPDGTYTVEATTFGPSVASGSISLVVNGAAVRGQMITLVPSSPIRVNVSEEFTITEGANAQGGLFEADGRTGAALSRRPRDLQMWLESADDFVQRQNASLRESSDPNDATLFIDNVQPGRYWVHMSSGRGYVANAECGGADILHRPLIVPQGGLTSPIEVTIRDDGANIDGVVEDAAAQKATQIYFVPVDGGTGQFRNLVVYGNSHFSYPQVPPGDYRVFAFDAAQGDLEYTNQNAMGKYESGGQYVHLLPGQKQRLSLHLLSLSD